MAGVACPPPGEIAHVPAQRGAQVLAAAAAGALGWATALVFERQECGLVVITIVVIVSEEVGTLAAASGISGLEAWRAADDAAFDGAVGGGGG